MVESLGERDQIRSIGQSVWRRRVKLRDKVVEGSRELWFVLLGVGADELDHLTVTVRGLFVLAAGLVNHPQPVIAVVHFGKAHEELACRLLSLIELAGAHEVDDGVGCLGEIVLFLQRVKGCQLLRFPGRGGFSRLGSSAREARVLGRFLFRQATAFIFVSAAAGAGIVASRFSHGAVWGSPVSHFTKKELGHVRLYACAAE